MSDHKNEALAWINGMDESLEQEGTTDGTVVAQPTVALVHATLYLAEQQRIANLIAAIDKWGGEVPSWPLAIREGLGLA